MEEAGKDLARHKVHKVKWLQNYMPPQEFFFSLTFSSRKKKLKGPKRNLGPATLCTLWCRAHPPPPPTPATQTRSHPKMKPLMFARDNPSSALLQVTPMPTHDPGGWGRKSHFGSRSPYGVCEPSDGSGGRHMTSHEHARHAWSGACDDPPICGCSLGAHLAPRCGQNGIP